MNPKPAIAIAVGIAIVIGLVYGISNSESNSNEEFESTLDDESVEPQNNEGKEFTLRLSDKVTAEGP